MTTQTQVEPQPTTAAGRAMLDELVFRAGVPTERLIRLQIVAIEGSAAASERLRLVERIRAVTLPFVEQTDHEAALFCHRDLHAILDALASESEPQ